MQSAPNILIITPFKLRHRLFVKKLIECGANVQGVVIDKSRSKTQLRSVLGLSRILNFVLSTSEFLEKGFISLTGVPIFEVPSLRHSTLTDLLMKSKVELIVVYGGKVIPRSTLDCIKSPCINIHGSILPGYRGLDSYWWALIEGNSHLRGYTIHFVDEGIDTGSIIRTKSFDESGITSRKHFRWRLWIAENAARDIFFVVAHGLLQQRGQVNNKSESVYRSKITSYKMLRVIIFRLLSDKPKEFN